MAFAGAAVAVFFAGAAVAGFSAVILTVVCFCEVELFVLTDFLLDEGGFITAGVFETADLLFDVTLVEVVLLPVITTVFPTTFVE
ncbi:MAG: hypothetical protein RL174_729 [Actinomycetota bacterium]